MLLKLYTIRVLYVFAYDICFMRIRATTTGLQVYLLGVFFFFLSPIEE